MSVDVLYVNVSGINFLSYVVFFEGNVFRSLVIFWVFAEL
jgi:hypothetical protein